VRVPGSKIAVPELPVGAVPRPALLDRLDQADAGQLVVVVAPPGFGKTTLLSSWVRRPGGPPTAWISLDALDDAARFRATLLAALAAIPDLPPDSPVRRIGRARSGGAGLDIIDELIEALDAAAPALRVVLDDLQELKEPEAWRDLARLVRHRHPGLRLVLSSRVDPPVPLPRLRLEGRLHELRAADLRFTTEDAAALLEGAGLRITPQQTAVLQARTEGWVAGLRFAALALRSSDDAESFIEQFSGSEQAVADYLTGEVKARLAPESRRLLRTAAICSELPTGLAVELFGRDDAGQVLDELARSTALVQRMDSETYRIHTLLRTYFATELERRFPDDHRRANAVAARWWWLAADEPVHALRHAEQAGDLEILRSLLRECGVRLIAMGQFAALRRALRVATSRDEAADPWLALLTALALHLASAAPDDVAALHQARRIWPADAPPALRTLRTCAELLLAGAGPPEADGDPSPTGSGELDALLTFSLARASIRRGAGEPGELGTRLQAVAAASAGNGYPYFEVWAESLLAELEMRRGGYGAMRAAAAAAVNAAAVQGRGPGEWAADAGALVAYGDLLAGDPTSARTRAETVLTAGSTLSRATEITLHVVHGTALGDLGERATGIAVCRAARLELGDAGLPAHLLAALTVLEFRSALAVTGFPAFETSDWLERRLGKVGEVLLMVAWAHLFDGRPEAARAALGPLVTGAVTALVPHTSVEVRLVLAEAALHSEDLQAGRAELAEALVLGERLGVVRPFALAAPLSAGLLRSAPPPAMSRRFAGRLAAAFAVVHVEVPAPLSERELAVLALLPSLLSGGEIAHELTVSVNTVKSHIRSIYKKLGVSNRRDAVRQAQERNLII
jgi:LuxR family maltose regulon positive regulatory protein